MHRIERWVRFVVLPECLSGGPVGSRAVRDRRSVTMGVVKTIGTTFAFVPRRLPRR